MKVVEAMHGAAGNHEDPAGAYLRDLSFEGEGEYAFEAIDGLFVAIVANGDQELCCREPRRTRTWRRLQIPGCRVTRPLRWGESAAARRREFFLGEIAFRTPGYWQNLQKDSFWNVTEVL